MKRNFNKHHLQMVYLPLELKFCQNSDCVHVLCGQFCCKSNYTVVLSRKQFFFCVKSQLKFNLVSCYLTFKQIITYSLQKFSIQKHTATVTKKACTHTHTRLMALFPGLLGWAGTRKVKPISILLKQETVSGRQAVASARPYASLHLSPDR